jgi:hypothetical protein
VSRGARKLLLLIGVLVFGVFYGISLSNSGIEEIYGPIEGEARAGVAAAEQDEAPFQAEDKQGAAEEKSLQSEPESNMNIEPIQPVSNSTLSLLLDKIGSLLNLLADHLIRLIVKLGEAVLS